MDYSNKIMDSNSNLSNRNDPGAVTLGNFINYYQFHPPEERLKFLPDHLLLPKIGENYVCLDIGCNTGELTTQVYESISRSLHVKATNSGEPKQSCLMLGIDIDPILIERAQEMNKYTDGVVYECIDFMNETENVVFQNFVINSDGLFDVIFCFSVTMWIHLNHGDDGLRKFLKDISHKGRMLVIEPQPWKCYKSAVKRLKRSQMSFPQFENIAIRENIYKYITTFLTEVCGFIEIYESDETKWGRKVLCFRRND